MDARKSFAIESSFSQELKSIIVFFAKSPTLNELKELKDRIKVLNKNLVDDISDANKAITDLARNTYDQISNAYIEALEKKIDDQDLEINLSNQTQEFNVSQLKEKDGVIGWLQTMLNRYESIPSLKDNPSIMWQPAPLDQPQQDEVCLSPRINK